ncbi:unnamed protein product [Strongylus vulgaris]|uniref:Uncharacterized protein n=1 Tax=Strongylus vulgaris TaxID=40348 RepID=A0A3P7JCL7_STRVU|nr:unnamed protein product [Strongylus vulgaris]
MYKCISVEDGVLSGRFLLKLISSWFQWAECTATKDKVTGGPSRCPNWKRRMLHPGIMEPLRGTWNIEDVLPG